MVDHVKRLGEIDQYTPDISIGLQQGMYTISEIRMIAYCRPISSISRFSVPRVDDLVCPRTPVTVVAAVRKVIVIVDADAVERMI